VEFRDYTPSLLLHVFLPLVCFDVMEQAPFFFFGIEKPVTGFVKKNNMKATLVL